MLIFYSGRTTPIITEAPETLPISNAVCVMVSFGLMGSYPDQRERVKVMEDKRNENILRRSSSE